MKNKVSIIILFFILMTMTGAVAQNQVAAIETLEVDIWPDYDRPSVLVLLTGKLPDNTTLPASVTLPLPQSARLNAVARIDQKDGRMKDDIFSSTDPPGMLTFTTPDLRFRVEYYFPYSVNENQHSFDYTWLAPIGVTVFRVRVQQPTSAGTFKTKPDTATIIRGDDGFEYHTFPARAVETWEPVSLKVDYHMANAKLSKQNVPPPITNNQPTTSPPKPGNESNSNWALVAMVIGGLIIFGILIGHIASRRVSPNNRKPDDIPVKKRPEAKYCRHCGEKVGKSGKFCIECGCEL